MAYRQKPLKIKSNRIVNSSKVSYLIEYDFVLKHDGKELPYPKQCVWVWKNRVKFNKAETVMTIGQSYWVEKYREMEYKCRNKLER